MSSKRFFIDSFAQHLAAALGLASVVCWVGTSPLVYGYELHQNILCNPYTPTKEDEKAMKFGDDNLLAPPSTFPFASYNDVFDVKKIIAAVENTPAKAA